MSWKFSTAEKPKFYEHAWKRDDLTTWDERWGALTPTARQVFCDQIPVAVRASTTMQPVAVGKIDPKAREELIEAGFLEPAGKHGGPVQAVDEVRVFGTRIKAIQRFRLLDPTENAFRQYLHYAFHVYAMVSIFERIVAGNLGPCYGLYLDEYLTHFVARRFWPDWVAGFLDDPVAKEIVRGVSEAGGRLPLESLAGRLRKYSPAQVRKATDGLIHHLALVEDLDAKTFGLVVGFRPEVQADRLRVAHPKPAKVLTPRPAPLEMSPPGGYRVLDARAVLLELASQRARIRQDNTLYAKEHDRFLPALVELPAWMAKEASDPLSRLESTVRLIQGLGFASQLDFGPKEIFLEISAVGQRWLSSSIGAQYDLLYRFFRDPGDLGFRWHSSTDERFLGSQVMALHKKAREKANLSNWQVGDDDRHRLREPVYRALDRLPAGAFVRQVDFIDAIVTGPDNPVLLGESNPREVQICYLSRTMPALLDIYEDYGRRLLRDVFDQLEVMGGIQAGLDTDGTRLISRQPWLDVYFGKAAPPEEAPVTAVKTVVQPDFSVIIMGQNPVAAADLATFCDREQGNVGQGALTFRIRRESILRAVGLGLREADILDRLKKHAGNTLPANVLRQIRDWCGQIRQVTSMSGRLFCCPDESTAERVRALLGKTAKRVGETMVFWADQGPIRPALRQKLRDQGVLLEGVESQRKVKRRGSS